MHGLQEKLLQPLLRSAGPPAVALPHLPASSRHPVRASRAHEAQGEGPEGLPAPARSGHADVPGEGGAGRAGSRPAHAHIRHAHSTPYKHTLGSTADP